MTLLQHIVGKNPVSFLVYLDPAKLNQFYQTIASEQNITYLSQLGRLIGGFGALFYISFRVWKHMANNEPINVFPLLRPFFIGFCLTVFPSILKIINALLHPMITITEAMTGEGNLGSYDCNTGTGGFFGLPLDFPCILFKYPVAAILTMIAQAVALGLNLLRLVFLALLAILGPIAFSLAIFDGFEGNIIAWLKKYVVIYMWLPVLNLLQLCINTTQKLFFASNSNLLSVPFGYLFDNNFKLIVILLIICIYTYTKVPSITSWIVEAGSPGGSEQSAGAAAAGYVGGALSSAKQGAMKVVAAKTGGASMAAQKVGSAISSAAKKN